MSDNSVGNFEVIQSSLKFFSQADLKKIVSKLISKDIVQKESSLFDDLIVTKSNKDDIEVIEQALNMNFKDTLAVINEIEINKVFKYGTMFEILTPKEIDDNYFLPLKFNEDSNENIKLYKEDGIYTIVFYEVLPGVKLDSHNNIENHFFKYPTIAMVYPEEKMLDLKVPTVSRMFQKDQRNFYRNRITFIKNFLNMHYDMNLQPLDLYSLTNFIAKENESEVKVSSQKMQLASGGNATLDSGLDSEEIILPILGELTKIVEDNKDLFDKNEESMKIKDLLEEFISETKETSELPWMSLRWPSAIKAQSMQVKFMFNHYDDAEFTMMQFYTNSRGMEGMRYVAKYLIGKYRSNSSGTSNSES